MLKKIVYSSLILITISCSSKILKITSSTKNINYPGIPTGKPFIGYEINFDVSNSFKVENLKFNGKENQKFFTLYSKELRKFIKTDEINNKGSYVITFKKENTSSINNDEFLILTIDVGNKIKKKKLYFSLKDSNRLK